MADWVMAIIWERSWRPAILLVALWGLASACGSAAEEIVASEPDGAATEVEEPADAPAQARDDVIDEGLTSTVRDVDDRTLPEESAYQPRYPTESVWELAVSLESRPGAGIDVVADAVDDLAVAGTSEGRVIGVDIESGGELWSVDLTGGAGLDDFHYAMYPTIAEDKVFVAASTGILYALDVSTGAVIWEASIGGLPGGFPVVASGSVLVPRSLGELYDDAVDYAGAGLGNQTGAVAFDASTGEEAWALDTDLYSVASGAGDGVLVGSYDNQAQGNGSVTLFDGASGEPLWEAPSLDVDTPVAVTDELVAVAASDLVVLDRIDGSERWRTPRDFCSCSFQFPAIVDGTVVVVANDGSTYGLDASSGKTVWRVNIGDNYGFAHAGPPGVVALGLGGAVSWIDAASGDVLAVSRIEGQVTSVESTPYGEIVASSDGFLRLFTTPERGGSPEDRLPAPVGQWVPVPDAPLSGRVGAVLVSAGDEIFVFGGSRAACPGDSDCELPQEPPFTDGAAFSLQSGDWRTLADAPIGIEGAPAVVLGDAIYVLHICSDGPRCPDGSALLRYRIGSDEWDSLSAPPDGFYGLVVAGERLIAFRGSDENGERPDYIYDPSADVWHALPDDPLPSVFDRQAVAFNDQLLLFGTPIGDASTELAASFDFATGTWTELPESGSSGFQAWLIGDLVYLNPHFSRADGGIYDPITTRWENLPAPPDTETWRGDLAGIIGSDEAVFSYTSGWILDTRNGAWLEVPPRPNADQFGNESVTAAGSWLFVFGGQTSSIEDFQLVNQAWVWVPPADRP